MSYLFPRSFSRPYLVASRSEGVYLYDEQGRRYLDAAGGAAVVSIGHGVREVIEAMTEAASRLTYAHTSQFHTRAGEELAAKLAARFPSRVFFTSGGSEATETAIKLVRQYWLASGQAERWRIVSRRHGYHGATLGALAVSGHARRRRPYEPLLASHPQISACFCRHCPLDLRFPDCDLACARELDAAIDETTGGFILEPVVGATSGAVPPEGYLRLVREICDRHGILMIADEILTGGGRTGRYFAMEHWGVTPDVVLLGKGLASGYAPLGAVLVADHVWQAIERGGLPLEHGFTYQGHPLGLAAGLAVQRYLEAHDLIDQARRRGEYLGERLERLRRLPAVADVRGRGLFWTVELEGLDSWQVNLALRERGVTAYPLSGTIDGDRGSHLLLAPPFVIEEAQLDELVEALDCCLR